MRHVLPLLLLLAPGVAWAQTPPVPATPPSSPQDAPPERVAPPSRVTPPPAGVVTPGVTDPGMRVAPPATQTDRMPVIHPDPNSQAVPKR
jgi:hypothetical protein